MKNKEWLELLKKCFGKQKDDRYHAIAMLIIYTIFIAIIILIIRVGGNTVNTDQSLNQTPTPTPNIDNSENNDIEDKPTINDVNYSYSYTITYNGVSEVYLGKRIDEKEKFTLIKDGITSEYAILNDNYLILENGIYHITDTPSLLFKYCNVEKILSLIENEIPTENETTTKYYIDNSKIAKEYNDTLSVDNGQTNSFQLNISNNSLKSIDLDLTNYITSLKNEELTLIIHMEFVDVGTTEDFEIKVS